MKRLFLALDPSSIVRHALAEYKDKPFEKLNRQGMRWVRPEKYHVTLCFLGDMSDTSVSELVSPMVLVTQAPKLAIGPLTGFPDLKRPGVLALGVTDLTGTLKGLQSGLHSALMETSEEYLPHLTLARMKPASTKLGHKLRDYIHSGAHPEELSWTPDGVNLYDSLPDGSFELIKNFPFRA